VGTTRGACNNGKLVNREALLPRVEAGGARLRPALGWLDQTGVALALHFQTTPTAAVGRFSRVMKESTNCL
jgi:hypothetical protein